MQAQVQGFVEEDPVLEEIDIPQIFEAGIWVLATTKLAGRASRGIAADRRSHHVVEMVGVIAAREASRHVDFPGTAVSRWAVPVAAVRRPGREAAARALLAGRRGRVAESHWAVRLKDPFLWRCDGRGKRRTVGIGPARSELCVDR